MKYDGRFRVKKRDPKYTLLEVVIPEELSLDLFKNGIATGTLYLDDGRTISAGQRSLFYALLGEITAVTGDEDEYMKNNILKVGFMAKEGCDAFSMSTVDMTTARNFIEYTLEFMFENDIPLSPKTKYLAREINNYLYLCLINRKCCVCGDYADVHHCTGSRVGMGNDRDKVDHVGRIVMALCRNHHTEIHMGPEELFFDKYKVAGIKLTEKAVKILKLNGGK